MLTELGANCSIVSVPNLVRMYGNGGTKPLGCIAQGRIGDFRRRTRQLTPQAFGGNENPSPRLPDFHPRSSASVAARPEEWRKHDRRKFAVVVVRTPE
jgi:hypothetical protein